MIPDLHSTKKPNSKSQLNLGNFIAEFDTIQCTSKYFKKCLKYIHQTNILFS